MRLHDRLVDRRLRFMDGRVPRIAADRSLRYMECRLVASAGALVAMIAGVALTVLPTGLPSAVVFGTGILWAVAWQGSAFRYGRAANLAIVRSLGLPDRAWRKVRAETPARFDAWLARARQAGR